MCVLNRVWWLVWFLGLLAPVVPGTAPLVVRGVWCVVCRVVGSCVVFGDPLEALFWAILGPCWAILGPVGAILGPPRALLGPSWGLLEAKWQKKGVDLILSLIHI